MQTTSQTWKDLYASGAARLEARAVIGGVTYTGVAPAITRALMQSGPEIGNAAAASCALTLRGVASSSVPRSAAVAVQMRLTDGTTSSEWLPAGTFYLSRRGWDPVAGALALECYDALLKADAAWEPSAGSWPRAMASVAAELATLLGLALDARTVIPTGSIYYMDEPGAGATIRDALTQIAQLCGGNWIVTPANALRLVPFAPQSPDAVAVAAVLGGVDAGETETVTGIRCPSEDATVLAGDDTGLVLDVSLAPVLAADLLERLEGAAYRPFTLSAAVCDPACELGDAVSYGGVTGILLAQAATLGPAFRCDLFAPFPAELADEYPYIGKSEKVLSLAKAYAREAVEALDDDLTQQEIFKRLTNDGAAQGMILYNGQLYVNASYMRTGTLDADLVSVINLNASNINTGTLSADLIEIMSYDPEIQVASELDPETLFAFETIAGGWIVNGIQACAGLFRLTNAEKFRGRSGTLTARLDSVPGGCEDWYDAYEGGEIVDVVETYEAFGPDKTYSSPEDAEEHGTPDASGDIIGVVRDGDEYIYTHDFTVPNEAVSFFEFSLRFSKVRSIVVKFDDRPGFRYSDYLTINKTGLKVGELVVDAEGNIDAGGDLKVAGETQLGEPLGVEYGGTGATDAAGARTNLGVTPANIGAVAKAGDTVTGAVIRKVNVDFDTPPSTEEWNGIIPYTDSGNDVKGGVYNQRETDGSYRTLLGSRGANGWGYIAATIDASGNQGYVISHPQAMLSALNIRWTKVTGTTGSTGVVGLGLARNRYMVFSVWSSVGSGASQIATPMVTANGTNWSALVETISHTAVANTSVTLYVGYIDFGAGNIS